MSISREALRTKYGRLSKRYDSWIEAGKFRGFQFNTYRPHAVDRLQLQPGDHVVDLACGTGLNFPLILERIGEEGRLTGVDLTPEMLKCASDRVEQNGWKNVELVQSDMLDYEFPERINAVLSTGAFGYISEYDHVIETAARALVPDGRLAILDGKSPEGMASWAFKLYVSLFKPFELSMDYFKPRPWETIERYFETTNFDEMYGGLIYISSGATPATSP